MSSTNFPTTLVPDAPTLIDAGYKFTNADRAKIDAQILGIQQVVAGQSLSVPAIATRVVDSSSAAITAGYGVMPKNGKVTLGVTAALSLGLYIAGIAITTTAPGASAQIVTQGFIDPSVINLGAGIACAVGLDTNGKPVRVTDPTCVSGLKHVGVCDAHGAIYVSPANKTQFDVADYGAIPDSDGAGGGTDARAALQAAIDAAGIFTGYAGNVAGGRVRIGDGRYRLSGPLRVRRSVVLEGSHGNGWFGSSVLVWDKDSCIDVDDDGSVGGIIIDNYLSGPASPGGVAGMRGDWSIIRNLVLSQAAGGNPFNICNGIAQIATATIEHVLITGFQGDGLRACTKTALVPNIDGSKYERLFVQACGRHGIWMKGTDSQVCEFGMIVVESNGVWGVKEESFFGNNYVTLLTESNGYFNNAGTWAHGGNPVGAAVRWSTSKVVSAGDIIMPLEAHATGYQYKCLGAGTVGASEPTWPTSIGVTVVSGGVTIVCWEEEGGSVRVPLGVPNSSTFGFFYQEQDQNGPRVPGCSILGGLWSPDSDPSHSPTFGVHEGTLVPIQNVVVPSAVPLQVNLGDTARQAVISFRRQAEANELSLSYNDTLKQWELIFGGVEADTSLFVSAPDAVCGPNRITLPDGYFVGRSPNQKQVRWCNAIPSASTTDWPVRLWAQGDTVWNTAPSAGGAPGWMCTTAGGWGGGRNYTNRTWTTSLVVLRGDGIEPSTPNGFVYVCSDTGASFGGFALTSGAEPTWPTSIGVTVTGADGVTWKCYSAVGATFKAMASLAS